MSFVVTPFPLPFLIPVVATAVVLAGAGDTRVSAAIANAGAATDASHTASAKDTAGGLDIDHLRARLQIVPFHLLIYYLTISCAP